MSMDVINPVNGKTIRSYEELSPADVETAIERADSSFSAWRHTSLPERSALLKQAAVILRTKVEIYAHLMAEEMGKSIREGRSETEALI